MLFYKFVSQEERRAFGGSDFIELQYCRLPHGSNLRSIISVDAISHWKLDSLYVSGDDMDVFFSNYHMIFDHGIYNNGKSGAIDVFGLNYYSPESTALIVERVKEKHPLDYEPLLQWLDDVKNYNRFYVLGV